MLGDDVKSGGPLAPPEGSAAGFATPVDLNAPYSWGLIYLQNEGNESAHVEALDLEQILKRAARARLVRGSGQRRDWLREGYHPSDGRPVVGVTIPPKMTYNVVVGLSATARGRHVIPEARVRYTSGGTTYEATFSVAVALRCAEGGLPGMPFDPVEPGLSSQPPILREPERLRKGGGELRMPLGQRLAHMRPRTAPTHRRVE